jgi:hypothetical protein
MDEEKVETIRNKYGLPFHYYGDTVRRLFVVASVIMILALPFLTDRLPVPTIISILVIVLLTVTAGFLAPRNRWVISLDLLVSIGAVITFEYYAVQTYRDYSFADMLFIGNQVLAILFLFASYYSSKTMRSLFNKTNNFH